MSGSNAAPPAYSGQPGIYGTLGLPSTSNIPGARFRAVSWADSSGNLWLFGGDDPIGSGGQFNDLWKFNIAAQTWTWVSGAQTVTAIGVYGTPGVAAPTNVPGGRDSAVGWTDRNGNLWLFGGNGTASSASGSLNDLWKFSPTNAEWTWMGGSSTPNASGVYGTQGVASGSNIPGSGPISCARCIDGAGNFWIYQGCALWEFSPTSNEWTWVSGSSSVSPPVYGTLGTASSTNTPGTRLNAVSWIDANGNFWLFGGESSGRGTLNDLWEFDNSSKEWTWVTGSNPIISGVDPPSVYGSQGMPSTSNTPGGREGSFSWTDNNGNLWLYGGANIPNPETGANLNELWEFNPTGKTWVWVGGGSTTTLSPTYGTIGDPSPSNTPGARASSSSWTDENGDLWLFGGVAPSGPGTYGFLNDLWRYQP